MRYFVGLSLLVIILWFNTNVYAGEPLVCFPVGESTDILLKLERGIVTSEELRVTQEQNEVLQNQVTILEEQVSVHKEKVRACESLVSDLQKAIEQEKQVCKDLLKPQKPSFFRTLVNSVGLVGVGILIGVLML